VPGFEQHLQQHVQQGLAAAASSSSLGVTPRSRRTSVAHQPTFGSAQGASLSTSGYMQALEALVPAGKPRTAATKSQQQLLSAPAAPSAQQHSQLRSAASSNVRTQQQQQQHSAPLPPTAAQLSPSMQQWLSSTSDLDALHDPYQMLAAGQHTQQHLQQQQQQQQPAQTSMGGATAAGYSDIIQFPNAGEEEEVEMAQEQLSMPFQLPQQQRRQRRLEAAGLVDVIDPLSGPLPPPLRLTPLAAGTLRVLLAHNTQPLHPPAIPCTPCSCPSQTCKHARTHALLFPVWQRARGCQRQQWRGRSTAETPLPAPCPRWCQGRLGAVPGAQPLAPHLAAAGADAADA
jgi:hypothetical protein